jgi:hypothetical protein
MPEWFNEKPLLFNNKNRKTVQYAASAATLWVEINWILLISEAFLSIWEMHISCRIFPFVFRMLYILFRDFLPSDLQFLELIRSFWCPILGLDRSNPQKD